jgi:hypothetical protein
LARKDQVLVPACFKAVAARKKRETDAIDSDAGATPPGTYICQYGSGSPASASGSRTSGAPS